MHTMNRGALLAIIFLVYNSQIIQATNHNLQEINELLLNGEIEKIENIVGDENIDEFIDEVEDLAQPQWAEWMEWTECSETCGSSGTKKRLRLCVKNNEIVKELSNCYEKDQPLESIVAPCLLDPCNSTLSSEMNSTDVTIAPTGIAASEENETNSSLIETGTESFTTEEDGISLTTVEVEAESLNSTVIAFTDVAEVRDVNATVSVNDQVENQTEEQVEDEVEDQAENQVEDSADDQVGDTVEDEVSEEQPVEDETDSDVVVTESSITVNETTPLTNVTTSSTTTTVTTTETSDEPPCEEGGKCGCWKNKCWSYCNLIPSINWLWCYTDSPATENLEKTDCEAHSDCKYSWGCATWCGA